MASFEEHTAEIQNQAVQRDIPGDYGNASNADRVLAQFTRLEQIVVGLMTKDGIDNAQIVFDNERSLHCLNLYNTTMDVVITSDLDQVQAHIESEGKFKNVEVHASWSAPPSFWKRLFLVEYDTLVSITCNTSPIGNWLYVFADLARDITIETPLIVDLIPDIVLNNPSVSVFSVPDAAAKQTVLILRGISGELEMRYNEALAAQREARIPIGPIIVGIAKFLWDNVDKILDVADKVSAAVDRRQKEAEENQKADEEKAQSEQRTIDRGIRDAKPMEGAEKAVDGFDRNKESIGSTC